MRVIRVPVADRPECAVALGHAFDLGRRIGADVIGTHIRRDERQPVAAPSDLWLQPMLFDSASAGAEIDNSVKARDAAEKVFASVAGEFGLPLGRKPRKDGTPVAIWEEVLGTPQYLMPIMAPMSDMVVVSRPKGGRKGGKTAKLFMMQALMHAHRPVLIMPQKKVKSVGRHVTIAWNQSGEAVRAVGQSLPVIRQAEKVTIVAAGEEDRRGPKSRHLVNFLKHHGVQAEVEHTKGNNPQKEVIGIYEAQGSDLLIMGAYSRSRVSELVFGGMTHHMLYEADIPVLMLHS